MEPNTVLDFWPRAATIKTCQMILDLIWVHFNCCWNGQIHALTNCKPSSQKLVTKALYLNNRRFSNGL